MNKEQIWIDIPKRGKDPEAKVYVEYHSAKDKDRPSIIFLPGGPGADHQKYKHEHTFLSGDYNLIFWDPRGCGKSKEIDFATYDMDTYVDDIVSICKHLKLEKVIVLGASFGAIAAQRLATKYPAIAKQLILAVGATSHHFLQKAIQNVERRGNKEQQTLAKNLFDGSLTDEEGQIFFEKMGTLYSHRKSLGEEVVSWPGEFNFEVARHGFTTYLKEFDFREELSKINCKTVILAGEKDWVCDVSESYFLAEKIPGSKLHVFKDASHMLTLDVKDQYQKKILEFLNRN